MTRHHTVSLRLMRNGTAGTAPQIPSASRKSWRMSFSKQKFKFQCRAVLPRHPLAIVVLLLPRCAKLDMGKSEKEAGGWLCLKGFKFWIHRQVSRTVQAWWIPRPAIWHISGWADHRRISTLTVGGICVRTWFTMTRMRCPASSNHMMRVQSWQWDPSGRRNMPPSTQGDGKASTPPSSSSCPKWDTEISWNHSKENRRQSKNLGHVHLAKLKQKLCTNPNGSDFSLDLIQLSCKITSSLLFSSCHSCKVLFHCLIECHQCLWSLELWLSWTFLGFPKKCTVAPKNCAVSCASRLAASITSASWINSAFSCTKQKNRSSNRFRLQCPKTHRLFCGDSDMCKRERAANTAFAIC